MRSEIAFILTSAALCFSACGGGATDRVNSNTAVNANAANNMSGPVQLDPANMPPGLSPSPIATPASPNSNSTPKGTPTPGIPSPEELKRRQKQGAGTTPTPGIPSAEEIRRSMGQQPSSTPPVVMMKGEDSQMMKKDAPMMKSTKKPSPTP